MRMVAKKEGKVSIPDFKGAKKELQEFRREYGQGGIKGSENLKDRPSDYGDVFVQTLERAYNIWDNQSRMNDQDLENSAKHIKYNISGEEMPMLNKKQALTYLGSAIREIRDQIKGQEDSWVSPSKERKIAIEAEYGKRANDLIEVSKSNLRQLNFELKLYQDMQKDLVQSYKEVVETGIDGKRTKPQKGIESKVVAFIAALLGGAGLAMVSGNITGNVIGGNSTSFGMGGVFVVIGIIGAYMYFKKD